MILKNNLSSDVRQTLRGRKLGPPCADIKAAKGKDPGECLNLTKQFYNNDKFA